MIPKALGKSIHGWLARLLPTHAGYPWISLSCIAHARTSRPPDLEAQQDRGPIVATSQAIERCSAEIVR